MKKFCSLAYIASIICAMSALYSIFSLVEGMENHSPGLAVWLLCALLCHLGLSLFLRRERTQRSLIVFCGLFIVLQAVLVWLVYGSFSGLVGTLIALCMWLYSYYLCYELNLVPLTAEKLTKAFDICAIVLVLLLFYCSVMGQSLVICLPLAVTTLISLLALIAIRGGEQRKLRSLVISGSVVLLFAVVALGFVAAASGGIKRLFELGVAALEAMVSFVFRMINALFLLLTSLFPEKEYEMEAFEAPEIALGPMQEQSFVLIDPQILMAIMLAVGLLIVLAFVVYRLVKGKRRIVAVSYCGDKGLRRSRSGVFAALRKAFSRLRAKLCFELDAIRKRNTAPGLFLQIERRSRAELHGRDKSESCREFLCRARKVYPWADEELLQLADAMDIFCFGRGEGIAPHEIIKMRRKIFSGESNTRD